MSKLKAIIFTFVLVGFACAGTVYLLTDQHVKQVVEASNARLANAEMLLLDNMRVQAYRLIEAQWSERSNSKLKAALATIKATEESSPSSSKQEISPNASLKPVLAGVSKKIKVAQVALVSTKGTVVTQIPKDFLGKSVKGLPIIKDCSQGIARDGLYLLSKKLRLVTVVPIQDERSSTLGCLMAARNIDQQLVAQLSKVSGLGVGIYLNANPIVSTFDSDTAKALAENLDKQNPVRFGNPKSDLPLGVNLQDQAYMARSIEIPGGTDKVHLAVLLDLSKQFDTLAHSQRSAFVGFLILLLVGLAAGLVLSVSKTDQELLRLRDSVNLMAEGNSYSIQPEAFTGVFQQLALGIRRATESKSLPSHSYQSPETVSQILGTKGRPPPEENLDDKGIPAALDFESLLGSGPPEPPTVMATPPQIASSSPEQQEPRELAQPLPTMEPVPQMDDQLDSMATPIEPPTDPYQTPVPPMSNSYQTPVPPMSDPYQTPVPPMSDSYQTPVPPMSDSYQTPVPPLSDPYQPPVQATTNQPPAAEDLKGPKVEMPGDLASFFDNDQTTGQTSGTGWDTPDSETVLDSSPPQLSSKPKQATAREEDSYAPNDAGFGEDRTDATVIAQVPDELLKAASTGASEPTQPRAQISVPPPPTTIPPPVAPPSASSHAPGGQPGQQYQQDQHTPQAAMDTEEAHYKEVFEQFIQTKNQCGEPVAGLSEEKFVEKLRKNTADLKTRYKCSSVRFQVYEKNGKAALKATPIK